MEIEDIVRAFHLNPRSKKTQDNPNPVILYFIQMKNNPNHFVFNENRRNKTCRKKDLLEWRMGLEFPERILIVSFTGCIIISFYGFTETTRSKKKQCLLIEKTRNC